MKKKISWYNITLNVRKKRETRLIATEKCDSVWESSVFHLRRYLNGKRRKYARRRTRNPVKEMEKQTRNAAHRSYSRRQTIANRYGRRHIYWWHAVNRIVVRWAMSSSTSVRRTRTPRRKRQTKRREDDGRSVPTDKCSTLSKAQSH